MLRFWEEEGSEVRRQGEVFGKVEKSKDFGSISLVEGELDQGIMCGL